MIIKSMSRKAPTFSQLAGYIGQDGAGGAERCFARNLHYEGDNQKIVSGLFWDNYQNLPQRKNGNALYHEIIVLEPQPHLTRQRQMQILHALARRYCERRAPHQLAWGRVHFDTPQPHIHLMISSNEIGSKFRKRLDRKSFANIQREVERFKEEHFPELNDQRIYQNERSQTPQIKSNEGELVRRTGEPSKKQQIVDTLSTLLAHHRSEASLRADLNRAGLSLYQRGQSWGVANTQTGKRYRLRTLGLEAAFHDFRTRLEKTPSSKAKTDHASPALDPRAQALLQRRQDLERSADQELGNFDRHLDEGAER
ncbi:MAG: relaxase/mobilization nuclease domain-containing protein [Pseudomonadota bacterium]